MTQIAVAYCWASGEIEIAAETEDFEVPEGVIAFARGEDGALRARLSARARHGYDGRLLVPGLPEISGEDLSQALDSLNQWLGWAFRDWDRGPGCLRLQPGLGTGGAGYGDVQVQRTRSLGHLKMVAKRLKRLRGITHSDALEEAARLAGFDTYHHARTHLAQKGAPQ